MLPTRAGNEGKPNARVTPFRHTRLWFGVSLGVRVFGEKVSETSLG